MQEGSEQRVVWCAGGRQFAHRSFRQPRTALLGKRCRLTQSRAGPSGSSTVLPADGPPLDPPRWTATSSALIKKRAAFQLTSVTSRAVSCTSAAAPETVSLTFWAASLQLGERVACETT